MKQVVLRGGAPQVVEVPAPSPAPGFALVATAASVISSGTERSAVSAGGGSLPMRAIRNPDLVLKALRHARDHGVRDTVELVRGVAADDIPLGYSCSGTVIETGGIAGLKVGQHVACAGAARANHAEVVSVPANLVAAVPEAVPLGDAAFTTLGAIAMQGVRRAEPQLGERVAVVGLGLLGLLTVQILNAAGCPVLGVEPVEGRRALALDFGADRAVTPEAAGPAVLEWSGGEGADAVIVTASHPSSAIVNQAVGMLRRKGRVVPVGEVGLGFERAPLYEREADVRISTSYGPGRYDRLYEELGIDYPIAYVRWTENRNMQEFLRLLATGRIRVDPLVGLELPVERAGEAYAAIAGDEPPLAAVLRYCPRPAVTTSARAVARSSRRGAAPRKSGEVVVALVGVGDFVRGVHLPNLKANPSVRIKTVVSRRGTVAGDVARSIGGAEAATDWSVAVDDEEVDLVVVGTRHNTHAEIAAASLRAGKAVFVEKPLGLSRAEVDDVWAAATTNGRLAVGFNRPFAPLAARLREELDAADGPLHVVYRVNAPLAHGHWLNDPIEGGGRVLGEACHMFDFANWLCGTPSRVIAAALPAPSYLSSVESVSATVEYAGGSVATVHYSGVGAAAMPKERIEVLRGGCSWVLDDFGSLASFDARGERVEPARSADKGHARLVEAVIAACRGERPFEPGIEAGYAAQSVALATLESIASGSPARVIAQPSAL